MVLRSGGGSLVAAGSCGGGAVVEVQLDGGGAVDTRQIWSQGVLAGFPCTHPWCYGFGGSASWANPDPCRLLVRRSCWWGVGHCYDFDRSIIVFFLSNGDLDHVVFLGNDDLDHVIFLGNGDLDRAFYIGDPFFSLPHTR
jgi:hypothetical protein